MAESTSIAGEELVRHVDALTRAKSQDHSDLETWDKYYEGRSAEIQQFLSHALKIASNHRLKEVIINWHRLVVDSLEERLDVEGFRINHQTSDDLWRIWQANDLDEQSQQAHVDALALGRSYAIAGTNDDPDEPPVVTVESAMQVYAHHDPRTRKVTKAIKRWRDDDDRENVTLYLPNETLWLIENTRKTNATPWTLVNQDDHNLGEVPVVPFLNRHRILDTSGVSELVDIAPLANAACKIATDMMTSAEFHAMPRRWLVSRRPLELVDKNGRPLNNDEQLAGSATHYPVAPDELTIGQFKESDLRNFHETINALTRVVAALAGLPPHFLGYSDSNPASADAIRSAETRLIKRAERRQRIFGGSWERVMRLALRMSNYEVPDRMETLETIWRDAATPTVAQKADATVKLYSAGIVSLRQARQDMQYTPPQITQMESDDQDATARILAGDFDSLVGPKPAPDEPAAISQ